MRGLHRRLQSQGDDSYIFWGRRHESISERERRIASRATVGVHGALSRVTDRAGFYSKRDTALLLERLDQIDPDVVHLHNLHGYYINVEMLFFWLASHHCHVKWTLHDCWAFTGHCPYFQMADCDKWMTGCFACPQKRGYPASLVMDSSKRNYADKKAAFTLLPSERMTLISPSRWLAALVEKSFLSKYPVEVVYNTIDRTIFRPTPSNFRERYGVGEKFMVLGVAAPWTERKGLGYFVRLAEELDDSFAIVLLGLSKEQIRRMPTAVTAVGPTNSQGELAKAYTAADVYVTPSIEETFGMTVVEAQACGTHVVVSEGSACAEVANPSMATVVKPGFSALKAALISISEGRGLG